MTRNIMIVGVGGQGTLLASRVMGALFLGLGFDVKVSEVHGMSQRGGSVVTYVKYGEKVNSPIIDVGEADTIIAFEQLEAYRWTPWLKQGGRMIVNTQIISPMPVITGAAVYPDKIVEKIEAKGVDIIAVDAVAAAGMPKAVNVALLGLFASFSGIAKEQWIDAVKAAVPPKFLQENLAAFENGYALKPNAL